MYPLDSLFLIVSGTKMQTFHCFLVISVVIFIQIAQLIHWNWM